MKPSTVVLASESARTIEGMVLPWGEAGATNRGEIIFPRGSLNIPSDLSRVKLLAGHSPAGVPVGFAIAAEERDEGLYMCFQLGSSEAATTALTQAQDHIIDSFSIEAAGVRQRGREATDGLLKAVALVPFPAFHSARIGLVNAEEHDEPHEPVDEPPTTDTTDEETKESEEMPQPTITPPATTARVATVPKGVAPEPPTEVHASLHEATEILLAANQGAMSMDEVHAALTDITGTNTLTTTPATWLGELWSGVAYKRRIVPLVQNAALRGRRAHGMRWKTKPTIAKWKGDKTDIHSSKAEWEEVEMRAQPWAGGNDLDRQIFDFKEADALRMYWAAMAESYAYETDKELAAFLVKNATDVQESAPDLIRAISRGAIRLDEKTHSPATFALVNPSDLETVLDFSQLDVPHFTGLTPVSTPDKWVTSEFVEKGTAIVGSKLAATFYELPGSPLRVEAEHIAKGGRDAALFGYTAQMINRADGLMKVHFAKSPAPKPEIV
ncbi:hypothetical protein HW450_10350 [Corynebacterium hindlerae]|uniref:Uncharacterized protein n=1 Tax=Corynebacterium hindlerae TaxID=699041 RepID=A0A7G5FDP3_9CORY|nr:hypothetical protein [Corynebacterium hindlerae]QMV84734.1 hypothetical protein HW450_10350 [Corynebacterium hindlerae]